MTQKLWLDEYVPCFKTICQPISCRETNGEKSYFLQFPKKSDILVPTQTGTVYQSRIYYTNLFFKSFFYGWLHSFSHWHTLKVLWRASCSRTIIWWIVKKSYSAGCDLLLDHLDYMLHVISDLLTYIWRGLHHTRSYKTPKGKKFARVELCNSNSNSVPVSYPINPSFQFHSFFLTFLTFFLSLLSYHFLSLN